MNVKGFDYNQQITNWKCFKYKMRKFHDDKKFKNPLLQWFPHLAFLLS